MESRRCREDYSLVLTHCYARPIHSPSRRVDNRCTHSGNHPRTQALV